VVLFIAALLGDFWGLITILLYVIIGLFPQFPIFAMGGGLSYVLQYNFGYILAYIFAVIIAGKKFQKSDSITNVLLGILYGVLIIHIIGTMYMLIVALFQHASSDFILHWIYFQTISKILFDIAFGIIAVLIAKLFRKILWILIG
jgi:biotin transporter BioY